MKLTDLLPTPIIWQKLVQNMVTPMGGENYQRHHTPPQEAYQKGQKTFLNEKKRAPAEDFHESMRGIDIILM